MAILIEGVTVVVPIASLHARFPGGLSAFEQQAPNATYRSDGIVAGISFMVLADAWVFVRTLVRHGFVDPSATRSSDVAVVEQQDGFLAPCDWLNMDLTTCNLPDGSPFPAVIAWMGATRPTTFAAPDGWSPRTMVGIAEDDLENNYELVKVDRHPESRGAVVAYRHRETGRMAYVGRPALEGQPPDEGYAALRQMLATVMAMPNSRERSARAVELCDRAGALVEDTKGAERGPLMIHGIAARLASRWTIAERAFRRVTELWPEELDGWLELTWALATLDRTDGALAAAQRAVELRPDNPAALGNLASALLQNGRAKEALPVIHRALELDPSEWKNQQIRDSVQAAAAEPELEPADETEPKSPWYKRWFRRP